MASYSKMTGGLAWILQSEFLPGGKLYIPGEVDEKVISTLAGAINQAKDLGYSNALINAEEVALQGVRDAFHPKRGGW